MTRRLVAATALVGVGVALSAEVAAGHPILASRWSLLWVLAAWSAVWLVSVAVVMRLPPRVAMVVIVTGAVGLRLAALAGPPVTSDDLYRYSWDGRVQAAGIDPYAQPPTSPALAGLRDPWLWPDPAGCAALDRSDGCTRINRPGQRTIYPPLAETWFAAAYRLGGTGAHYKTWQVAGLVTDLAAVGLLIVGLGRWGRDRRWVALYALSPAPVLEVVNNGHVDGLAVVFLLGALLVVAPGRRRGPIIKRQTVVAPGRRRGPIIKRQTNGPRKPSFVCLLMIWRRLTTAGEWSDVAAGGLIGAAALVKIYPALALVALGRGRRLVRAATAAAALGVLAYLPHVQRVGAKVLGYLPGYFREEHYSGGGRYLVAAALHAPAHLRGPVSALAVAGAVAWVLTRRPSPPAGAALLLGALLLAVSPVQPWYAVSLLAVATLAAEPAWVAVVLAGYPYFFAVILASPHAAAIGEMGYASALAVVWLVQSRGHASPAEPSYPSMSGATSSTRLA